MLSFISRAVTAVAVPCALLAAPAAARAGEDDAPIAWGVRANGAGGLARVSDETDGGFAWRIGLEGEYWLSRHLGVGAQLGYQKLGTFDLCFDQSTCASESASRLSLAPSITLRGPNPTNFGALSLALGYSWGHTEMRVSCDSTSTCTPSQWAGSSWGPYGSLTGEWVFHTGDVRRGFGAIAVGPMLRADIFTLRGNDPFGFDSWGFTVTAGMTLGIGIAEN